MGGEGGQQERWAPFPVQDWSTMPGAAPTSRPEHGPPPGPAFPPPPDHLRPSPARRRVPPRWLPGLVICLSLLLLAGGLYRVDRIGRAVPSVVADFVPIDGAVTNQQVEQAGPDGAETRTVVVESARTVGADGLLSLDFTLGSEVITALGADQVDRAPLWRTIRTPVDPDGTTGPQTTWVHEVAREVALVAESGPNLTRVHRPALVLLPVAVSDLDLDHVDGAVINWDRSGQVTQQKATAGSPSELTYAATFTGQVQSPGCVRVDGTIDYADPDGSMTSRTLSQLWCTGRGVVESVDTEGDVRRTSHPGAPPTVSLDTSPPGTDWDDPDDWRLTEVAARSVEPQLGEGMLAGTPGSLPPVRTGAGTVVRVSSAQDLIGLDPGPDSATVVSRWRTHPGGTVVSLTAFGDLVVAATSQRSVVAYTATGVRMWRTDLPDLAFTAPVVVDDHLLVTTISGQVHALDRQDGSIRWQTALRSDVAPTARVAADPDLVMVVTGQGDVVALDTRTGTERWRTEVDRGVLVARVADQVVVVADQAMWGLAATDGTIRWRTRTGGTPQDLWVTEDGLLVRAQDELISLGLDGSQRWVRPAPGPMVSAGNQVALVNGDALELVDRNGHTLTEATIPPAGPGSNRQLITTENGVGFFDNQWDAWRWER